MAARVKLLRLLAAGVGLAHGLLYMFLMPPWQHYDEPAHFEAARLTYQLRRAPTPADVSPALLREIQSSMVQHKFYAPWSGPDVSSLTDAQLNIGFSQLGDPPGYYMLAAIGIAALANASTEAQLYGTRMVSVALLAISLASTSKIAQVVAPRRATGIWLAPLMLGLLPAFADVMSACNSTAANVAAGALLTWFASSFVLRRSSLRGVLAMGGAIAACVMAGTPALLLIPAAAVALNFGFFTRVRWLAWGVCAMTAIAAPLAAFSTGDVAYWFRGTHQAGGMQRVDASGNAWLMLNQKAGAPAARTFQLLPGTAHAALAGQEVIIQGVWRANRPIRATLPTLSDVNGRLHAPTTSQVAFQSTSFALSATLPVTAVRSWVWIEPGLSVGDELYFDDLSLSTVANPGVNLLRNGAMDASWPRLRGWESGVFNRFVWGLEEFNLLLAPLDLDATRWLFDATARRLVGTLWTTVAWGHIFGAEWTLWLALALMTTATVGVLTNLRALRPEWFVVALVAILVPIALTFLRGFQSLIYPPYLPVARYFFPVLPIAVAIAVLPFGSLTQRFRRAWLVPIACMLAIATQAAFTVSQFYLAR
jgi:hypothetical protein